MQTTTQLKDIPNFSLPLQAMRIIFDIQKELAGNRGILAQAIKKAIEDKKPSYTIIKMLQDCAEDNYEMVKKEIGESLTKEIIKF